MKTDKMIRIETERGEPIEQTIEDLLDRGYSKYQIANHLGISQQTFYVWLDLLGLEITTTTRRELRSKREPALTA